MKLFSKLSWRSRRQLTYLMIPVVPTILLASFFTVRHFTTATCNDGKINQGELGIDCEGPCPQICQARIVEPEIEFANAFLTNPNTYNLIAKINNLNSDLGIKDAKVLFEVLDDSGQVVSSANTTVDMSPQSSSVAFYGPLTLAEVPNLIKATLQIGESDWQPFQSSELELQPLVSAYNLTQTDSSPQLQVTIDSNIQSKTPVLVPALILGEDNMPVAASQTEVIFNNSNQIVANYTWPRPFPTSSAVCTQPVDVIMAIDASGSMNSDGDDPPQPLTTVKFAANNFAQLFSESDRLGVVSFATDASIQTPLSSNIAARSRAIDNIVITPEAETGYTNVAQALAMANIELTENITTNQQAIILLTDGLPTAPDGQPDAQTQAIQAAVNARSQGITIFAIGLGNRVNYEFLRALTGNDQGVYQTTNPDELTTIYSQIATSVCQRAPYKVEAFPNPAL